MKIAQRPTESITPYPDNPRDNGGAVDAVAASIKEFGWRQPIVVDRENVIVVGHTRWYAAQQLGLKRVPVHVADDLTPEQARAYRIADNRTGEIADWDDELLAAELAGLSEAGFEMDVLGFKEKHLVQFMAQFHEAALGDGDVAPAPDPPSDPETKHGDVYILGDHRLVCGDAGSDHLDLLLDGAEVHLVHTDPPYNVQVEPRSANAIAAGASSFPAQDGAHVGQMRPRDRAIENDDMSEEEFADVLAVWFSQIARVLLPGRAFYLWGGYSNIACYPPALETAELKFSQTIIWHKLHPTMGRKDFMGDHEMAFYGWRKGAAHQFFGPDNIGDVWAVKKVSPQSRVHLTEKPVELAERAIEYSSREGENVLDLFGGSGSTLIAAQRRGRNAYLMELDPAYCDVIVQRWEEYTGKKAKRVRKKKAPAKAGAR